MSDDELDQAKTYARTNDAHEMLDAVYEERARRTADAARKQAVEEAGKSFEQKLLLRDIHQKILTDFGPEAFNDESELKQVASNYLRQQANLYGEASINPHKLYDAYSFAERQTKVLSERSRLQELEQENRTLREQASLAERGGAAVGNARPLTDEVKDALKRGDRKRAVAGLAVARSLVSDVTRSLLPPRS
jgi:predicted metalloendopeptidase